MAAEDGIKMKLQQDCLVLEYVEVTRLGHLRWIPLVSRYRWRFGALKMCEKMMMTAQPAFLRKGGCNFAPRSNVFRL